MLWTTAAQSVSKNITCTSVRIRGAFSFNIRKQPSSADGGWKIENGDQFGDVAGLVCAREVCHRSSCAETAATTSSTLTAFMQRKSIGHSGGKQGLHST